MKNKKIKYCLIGILILVLFTIAFIRYSPISKALYAAEKLKQKYQEKFTVISGGINTFYDYYTVKAYSDEYPDLIFEASVNNKTGEISDTYVTKRLCKRISNKINQNLTILEDEYYVYTEAMLEETVITDPTVSMEEYLKEGSGNKFTIHLFINQNKSSVQNIASAVNNMMNGVPEFNGSIDIYFTDSNLLAKIKEYLKSNDKIYFDFREITDEAYIGNIAFENSHVALTEYTLNKMASDSLSK